MREEGVFEAVQGVDWKQPSENVVYADVAATSSGGRGGADADCKG